MIINSHLPLHISIIFILNKKSTLSMLISARFNICKIRKIAKYTYFVLLYHTFLIAVLTVLFNFSKSSSFQKSAETVHTLLTHFPRCFLYLYCLYYTKTICHLSSILFKKKNTRLSVSRVFQHPALREYRCSLALLFSFWLLFSFLREASRFYSDSFYD